MQFEIGISTMRYFPPKGTAGFERSFVKGNSREPLPPPSTMDRTLAISSSSQVSKSCDVE